MGRQSSPNFFNTPLYSSAAPSAGDEVEDDDDGDDDDVSRMENRSIDVLVDDDDGGTQLIAYSVFEQVRATIWFNSQYPCLMSC